MISAKRNIAICVVVMLVFIFPAISAPISAAETTEQILKSVDEILKENPVKPGQKVQTIKVAENDTITVTVIRALERASAKKHVHKNHDETLYFVKGTGQLFIRDKWVDVKPGSIHFNPAGKVHTVRNTGQEPLVVISIFAPGMKVTDRHFVE